MPESRPVHTLVFDLDDTLYPEADYVRSGFASVGRWVGENWGRAGFEEKAWERFGRGERGHIFDAVLADLDLPPTPERVQQLVTVYRGHEPVLKLFPDAAEALDHWGARVALGLISDGFLEVQRRKVRALDLESRIPWIVLSDELGRECWKPSPAPFRKLMELAGTKEPGFAYVADNPRKDFRGARELGWMTIRVRRPNTEHGQVEVPAGDADAAIPDLGGLETVLRGG